VTITLDKWTLLAVLGGVLVIALLTWWILLRRRRARSLPARLARACQDVLGGVLVPDGEAGHIHIEYALLTRRGIVILDTRDVDGNVFGSEAMQEWTVLARNRRFTFANPLPALYDRLAAVKRLIPEVPVMGYVGFTARSTFSKGQPPNTILLDGWIEALEDPAADGEAEVDPALLQAAWVRLRAAAENPAGRVR
jgi:hypothetical protein